MADDKTKRGTADASKISLSEDYEVRYWMEALGVTKEQLTAAVKAVGNSAATVRAHLQK